MNWRNLFKSSHALWLETQVAELRKSHLEELGRMKSAYAEEIKRVIQDNQKLRDDLDRTRLLLTPALQSVTLKSEQDSSPPPTPSPIEGGTPWMRFRARAIAEQEATAATVKNYTKPVDAPVKGEHHGDAGRQGELAS